MDDEIKIKMIKAQCVFNMMHLDALGKLINFIFPEDDSENEKETVRFIHFQIREACHPRFDKTRLSYNNSILLLKSYQKDLKRANGL